MSKRHSELNPDYVKFSKDKKQAKETKRHLEDRLRGIEIQIKYQEKWIERSKENFMAYIKKREEIVEKIKRLTK